MKFTRRDVTRLLALPVIFHATKTAIATASVRISKALIAPARNGDMAGVRYILSAFAASPEISCVRLVLKKLPESQYWPYEGCAADQTDMIVYRQPVRQAMRRLGQAAQ